MQSSNPAAEAKGSPQLEGLRLGFRLPPKRTSSQWADANRVIARGTGPEPGPWRTDRTPYIREPQDAVNDPSVEILVLMWSSQVGKTEILINNVCFFIDQDPAPQMFVLPTLEIADSFSTKRFRPTIEATPALREAIGDAASRDSTDTIREKAYPGGDLVFAGANSASSLASRPRRVVQFDEIDKYKHNVGNDGDPIRQGFQRTANFWNRKLVLASTPSILGFSLIAHWYGRSDQRQYFVPCHSCGEHQPLEWETTKDGGKERRVRWTKGKPSTAHYVCVKNGCIWDQRQLELAVRFGSWRSTVTPTSEDAKRIRGYHINSLASPWVSMAQLAQEWEDAEGKPTEEQTFVNLKLGLPYNPMKGAASTAKQLLDRAEDYGPDKLRPEILLVTAFVDVQQNRFECLYLGFGDGEEKWVIDHAVHYTAPRDPTDPRAWEEMETTLLRRTFKHPLGGELMIEAIGIDAGYMQTQVMNFVRERRAAFLPYYAVKGNAGFGKPLWRESEEKFKMGAKLYLSGVDEGKTTAFLECAVVDPRPRVHFPKHLELGWYEQLIESEKVSNEVKAGRVVPKWIPVPGKRNEVLDCFVGACAVRHSIKSVDYARRRDEMSGTPRQAGYTDLAGLFKR